MTSFALAALLLLPQAAPQASPPDATRTFTDPNLRLSFVYPAAFIPRETDSPAEEALHKPGPDGLPSVPCITTPLFALRKAGPHQEELLLMLKLDFGCMGRQVGPEILTGIATNTLRQALGHIGRPSLGAPVPYSLGKHDSLLVQGSVDDPRDGIPGHAAAACTLLVNTVVCWEVLTAFPSHLLPLLATTVTFGKAAPIPIVPAGIAVAPAGPDPAATPSGRTP